MKTEPHAITAEATEERKAAIAKLKEEGYSEEEANVMAHKEIRKGNKDFYSAIK